MLSSLARYFYDTMHLLFYCDFTHSVLDQCNSVDHIGVWNSFGLLTSISDTNPVAPFDKSSLIYANLIDMHSLDDHRRVSVECKQNWSEDKVSLHENTSINIIENAKLQTAILTTDWWTPLCIDDLRWFPGISIIQCNVALATSKPVYDRFLR